MLTKKTTTLALLAACLLCPSSAAAWTWPADGPVLRPFDFGGAEYHERGHSGIDVGGIPGSVVKAPAPGQVSFAGWLPSHGRTVTIRTEDGFAVTLLHLGSFVVNAGDGVAEGEAVGTIGPSGDPELDVPYVHLGIRRADAPKGYVDPLTLLPPRHEPATAPVVPPAPPTVAPPSPQPVAASAPPVESEAPRRRSSPRAPAARPVVTAAPTAAAAKPARPTRVRTVTHVPAASPRATAAKTAVPRRRERARPWRSSPVSVATAPNHPRPARVTTATLTTVEQPNAEPRQRAR